MIELKLLILTITLITLVVSQSDNTETSGTATSVTSDTATTETSGTATTAETSGTATTVTSDTAITAETSGSCSCPTSRTPVCGTNGRTYDNKCKCDCDGVDVDCEGECMCIRDPKLFGISLNFNLHKTETKTSSHLSSNWRDTDDWPCSCPRHLDPVCGWNGMTYENACLADCDGVELECRDECRFCDRDRDREDTKTSSHSSSHWRDTDDWPCSCPRHLDPVCGWNGMTYENACLADCDGVEVECRDECRFCDRDRDRDWDREDTKTSSHSSSHWRDTDDWPCSCPRHLDPVCGWNGMTYENACLADCDGVELECRDECRFCDRDRVQDRDWDREDCSVCSDHWDPVCGEDGWSSGGRRTYRNSCMLRCNGARVVFNGDC